MKNRTAVILIIVLLYLCLFSVISFLISSIAPICLAISFLSGVCFHGEIVDFIDTDD